MGILASGLFDLESGVINLAASTLCPSSRRSPSARADMSKRIRIFTEEDVAKHSNTVSCWVTRDGKVYDVTTFLADHPGGDDLILNWAGKDIGAVMKDPVEHEHSDSAYDMLEEFVIGRLGAGENIVDESAYATELRIGHWLTEFL